MKRKYVKHGFARTAEYVTWKSMCHRCLNPKSQFYFRYGGRGIRVADEWLGIDGFRRFLAHIGPRPSAEYSIDRIDNDGNYEPGNVRWATLYEQYENRSTVRHLTVNGKTKSVTAWGRDVGLSRGALLRRLKKGWSAESTVLTPRQPSGRKAAR